MTVPVWIQVLPGDHVDKIAKIVSRDITQESILAEEDAFNEAYIVPVMMQDWIPEFFEGLVQRQPQTRRWFLRPDQVQVIRRPE